MLSRKSQGLIFGIMEDVYADGRTFFIHEGRVVPFVADLDFSVLTFEDESVVGVSSFSDLSTRLNNAYPNPALGEFTVSYSLDQSREVIIELYDMNGRKLQRIFKGRQRADEYLETISVPNLPRGMYLYGISTETGHSVTRRIVVN